MTCKIKIKNKQVRNITILQSMHLKNLKSAAQLFSIVSQLGIHRLHISELGSSGNDRSGPITLDNNVFIRI